MRYKDRARPFDKDSSLKAMLATWEANHKLLMDIDRRSARRGVLLWRCIAEPCGDGAAHYQIVKVNKRTVCIEVCRELGDDWVVPHWGERASITLKYAEQAVGQRMSRTSGGGNAGKLMTDKKPSPQQALLAKYPRIFRRAGLTAMESCMVRGLECDAGWLPLIDDLCDLLQFNADINGRPQVEATQVKEKMGILVFSIAQAPDWNPPTFGVGGYPGRQDGALLGSASIAWTYLKGIVAAYAHMSRRTCEQCGNPGVLCRRPDGRKKTLCSMHAGNMGYATCVDNGVFHALRRMHNQEGEPTSNQDQPTSTREESHERL